MNDDEMVLFKVRDYTTEIVGRRMRDSDGEWTYYVERGDGTRYSYEGYRVEFRTNLKRA